MPSTSRALLLALGLALLAGATWTGLRYRHDLDAARERVSGRSQVLQTRWGRLEYAVAGNGGGPALLMIHGTGGGFDQGLRFADALLARGLRVIAPSRFGYLRSDFPADPSLAEQADALATLLDHLAIERIVVAGGSAGALSASQFALRHPARCAGLVLLVPAANVRDRDPVEFTPVQAWLVRRLLSSDLLFWLAEQTMPRTLIGTLLATDPALLDRVTPAERERAFTVLHELLPISARVRGLLNDGQQAGHPARMDFTRLAMPVLIVSTEDDRFGTAHTARDIAAQLPQARLVILPDGGHLWLGRHEVVADEVQRFVRGVR
jgi:pimeloyl-ACP methyl ester carboxylesterase